MSNENKDTTTETNSQEQLFVEINGELLPIVEGIEYVVPADEAEDMGAIEAEEQVDEQMLIIGRNNL